MRNSERWALALALGLTSVAGASGTGLHAQSVASNPYHAVHGWEKLPHGWKLGVPSGIFADPDGRHLWILSRCGANHCAGSDQHQVFKLDQEGRVLMTLGRRGVSGYGPDLFNGPSGVVVAPSGDIWITDGHRGGNNRVVKFSGDGRFLLEIGGGVESASGDPGKFNDPHDITLDRRGRVLVADRGNNRVQLFDQQGKLLAVWTQFGRPSTVKVDGNDVVYVGDGMSGDEWNPGWERGIRIGDARTGWVTAFIPDSEAPVGTGVEFIGVDARGDIYAGEVGRQRLVKYVRFRP